MQLDLFVDAKIAKLCFINAKLHEDESRGLKIAQTLLNPSLYQSLLLYDNKPALIQRYISSWEWIKEVYARNRPPVKSAKILLTTKNHGSTPLSVITRLVRNYKGLIAELSKIFPQSLSRRDIRWEAIIGIRFAYLRLNGLKRALLMSMKNHSRKTLTYKYY